MEKNSNVVRRLGGTYRTPLSQSEVKKNSPADNNRKTEFGHITPKAWTNADKAPPIFGKQRNTVVRTNLVASQTIRLANEIAMPPLPLLPPSQTLPDSKISPSDDESSESEKSLQGGAKDPIENATLPITQDPEPAVADTDNEREIASHEKAESTPASPRGESVLLTQEEPTNPISVVDRPRVNRQDRRNIFRQLKNQPALTFTAAQTHKAAKIQMARTYLPKGIDLDEDGFLFGHHNKEIISTQGKSRLLQRMVFEFNNQPLNRVYFNSEAHKRIALDATHVFANGNVYVNLADGLFYNKYYDDVNERVEQTSRALLELAGSSSAGLSRLLTSAVPLKLLEYLTSEAGPLSKNFMFIGNSQDRIYLLPSSLELADVINNIKGTDDAKFTIYKDGDSGFNVTCEWTAYCLPSEIQKIVHLGEDEIIRVDIEATFKVAKVRETFSSDLEFTMPDGINAVFAGRLQLN